MSKKILVVDDEIELVNVIKIRLEANGYEVISAYDGQEALEKAKKENPDLIILDLIMPKMDGYKALSMLKDDQCYAKTPIIILTGSGVKEYEKFSQGFFPEAYITKPVDSDVLLAKIKELLSKR